MSSRAKIPMPVFKGLPKDAQPITMSMVGKPGPMLPGFGDIHATIAFATVETTVELVGAVRSRGKDCMEYRDAIESSAASITLRAYRVIFRQRGYGDFWRPKRFAGIARRAASETFEALQEQEGVANP